jgi:nickel/cobalt exporter
MKRLMLALVGLAVLAVPAPAVAHPLGNFTVNRFASVEPAGDAVYVRYVLDMAEIPAYQERQRMTDERRYARTTAERLARGLVLRIDGRRVPLRVLEQRLGFPPGVAGLSTLRLEAAFRAPLVQGAGERRLTVRDTNLAGRIGWRELVVRPQAEARVRSSSVPADTISNALRSYPKDLLRSPLAVTAASATFSPGDAAGRAPALSSAAEFERRVSVRTADGGFAGLITADDLSAGVIAVALLVSFFWGAAHAFSPGHGKAIVAGYLVGSRGTSRHALYLGLIVTVTHTIGVFALGLVTLALSEFLVPEQLYPWLNLVAALLVVGVGLTIARWRLREWRKPHDQHDHNHEHQHHHQHHHEARGLLGIGISAGILPCPTALVVLLAAISLHRVGYGLVLIVAFSVGLAAAVTGIGFVAVTAKRLFARSTFESPLVRALPAVSAIVVLAVGVAMTVRAIPPLI